MHHLICYCLNDACRHQALIDVSSYPAETEVPWFKSPGEMRQVRRAWQQDRRTPELEGAAGTADEACGMSDRCQYSDFASAFGA